MKNRLNLNKRYVVNDRAPLIYKVNILIYFIIFQHFVFVVSIVVAFIIPDIPDSIKNESKRQKLLSNAAVLARKSKRVRVLYPLAFYDLILK